jgi:hypothetical protein
VKGFWRGWRMKRKPIGIIMRIIHKYPMPPNIVGETMHLQFELESFEKCIYAAHDPGEREERRKQWLDAKLRFHAQIEAIYKTFGDTTIEFSANPSVRYFENVLVIEEEKSETNSETDRNHNDIEK